MTAGACRPLSVQIHGQGGIAAVGPVQSPVPEGLSFSSMHQHHGRERAVSCGTCIPRKDSGRLALQRFPGIIHGPDKTVGRTELRLWGLLQIRQIPGA